MQKSQRNVKKIEQNKKMDLANKFYGWLENVILYIYFLVSNNVFRIGLIVKLGKLSKNRFINRIGY